MRERLSTSKLRIGRADRPGDSEHLAVAFQHGECYVLICEPPECGERNHSLRADYDQPTNAMSYTWKTGMTAFGTDPVFEEQVTAIDPDFDAVAEKRHDAMAG